MARSSVSAPRPGIRGELLVVVQFGAERRQLVEGLLERDAVLDRDRSEVVHLERDPAIRAERRALNRFRGLADVNRRGPQVQVVRRPRVMMDTARLARLLDQLGTTLQIDREADVQRIVQVTTATQDGGFDDALSHELSSVPET